MAGNFAFMCSPFRHFDKGIVLSIAYDSDNQEKLQAIFEGITEMPILQPAMALL